MLTFDAQLAPNKMRVKERKLLKGLQVLLMVCVVLASTVESLLCGA